MGTLLERTNLLKLIPKKTKIKSLGKEMRKESEIQKRPSTGGGVSDNVPQSKRASLVSTTRMLREKLIGAPQKTFSQKCEEKKQLQIILRG